MTGGALRRFFLLLLVAGCGADRGTPTMAEDEFIDVMVALRLAERRAGAADSTQAVFDSMRDEVLGSHAVSEEDLRRFVAAHGTDLRRMERVWERIERRLRRPEDGAARDTVLPTEVGPAPDTAPPPPDASPDRPRVLDDELERGPEGGPIPDAVPVRPRVTRPDSGVRTLH